MSFTRYDGYYVLIAMYSEEPNSGSVRAISNGNPWYWNPSLRTWMEGEDGGLDFYYNLGKLKRVLPDKEAAFLNNFGVPPCPAM